MEAETLVELPSRVEPLTTVRSTLIQSSLIALKARNLFDAYLEQLDPKYRGQVLEALAPEWLSIDAGIAHYQACDALLLTHADLQGIKALDFMFKANEDQPLLPEARPDERWKVVLKNDMAAKEYFVGTSCKLCGKTSEFEFGQKGI